MFKLTKPVQISVEEFGQLIVGDFVLAKYTEDQEIYRAQVEEILEVEGEKKVQVRFFDYGNAACVGQGDLYPWETRYDLIKPQSVACKLQGFRATELSQEQLEEFSRTMRSLGKLSMRVVKVLRSGDSVSTCLGRAIKGPHLLVSLCQDGRSLETTLGKSPLLAALFQEEKDGLQLDCSTAELPAASKLSSSQLSSRSVSIKPLSSQEKVEGWLRSRGSPGHLQGHDNPHSSEERLKLRPEGRKKMKSSNFPSKPSLSREKKKNKENSFTFPSKDIRTHCAEVTHFVNIKRTEAEDLENDRNSSGNIKGADKVESSDDASSVQWDPMAEDYEDFRNNYKARDDDLEYALDWYQTKGRVCPFILNKGRCYKGDLCEDRHVQLRAGAVTADLQEEICETLDPAVYPVPGTTVMVHITNITSPSSFHVTFPHGDTNILYLTEEAKKKTVMSQEMEDLFERMQEKYKAGARVLALDSPPAPGCLVAARVSGSWFRAIITEDTGEDGELCEVFLVDVGRVETSSLRDVRRLDQSFTLLPYQAHEADLSQLEPLGGVWGPEVEDVMANIISCGDFLTGKIVKILPNEKLNMEISVVWRDGEEEEEVELAECLCELGHAVKIVKTQERGKNSAETKEMGKYSAG